MTGRWLAGLLLVLAGPAVAQDFGSAIDPGIVAGIAGQPATEMQARRMAGAKAGGIPAPSPRGLAGALAAATSGQPVAGNAAPPRLAYPPTSGLRREAVANYVAHIEGTDREAANVIRGVLAKQDYAAVFDAMIEGTPRRADDAVDAVTFYTPIGWQIANRDPAEIADARVAAVRRQLAPALVAAPALRAALGEEMKLLALTLDSGWQCAQREGTTRQYSDGVARMWIDQTARDLRADRLSDAGFVMR